MSGFSKSFESGFFHALDDYKAIAFIASGGLTIRKGKAIFIDYTDLAEVKFIDGEDIIFTANSNDVDFLLFADCFCDYLGIGVLAAYSELRKLIQRHIQGGSVDIVGQIR